MNLISSEVFCSGFVGVIRTIGGPRNNGFKKVFFSESVAVEITVPKVAAWKPGRILPIGVWVIKWIILVHVWELIKGATRSSIENRVAGVLVTWPEVATWEPGRILPIREWVMKWNLLVHVWELIEGAPRSSIEYRVARVLVVGIVRRRGSLAKGAAWSSIEETGARVLVRV